jgi:hypothetical protein
MNDFKPEGKPANSLIEKYRPLLPEKLISLWQDHGFGTMAGGYLKVVNPEDFEQQLKEVYNSVYKNPVVMFATAMGDLVLWENNYTILLNLRHGLSKVIESGFQYFLKDVLDKDFVNDELDGAQYFEAKDQFGELAFDDCFGYVPLLGLGGAEEVKNLQKVKMKEHISVIAQALGKVE